MVFSEPEGAAVQRVAQVIKVRPERLAECRELHRAVPQPVLDRLRRSNIANYSIHLRRSVLQLLRVPRG
jgi:L-rhamnose mutarotase